MSIHTPLQVWVRAVDVNRLRAEARRRGIDSPHFPILELPDSMRCESVSPQSGANDSRVGFWDWGRCANTRAIRWGDGELRVRGGVLSSPCSA